MIKRLLLALTIAGFVAPAYAAGTIPYSLSQQLDIYGKPLANCRLYIIKAGTSEPQDSFQDAALTRKHTNPISCDAAGRLPQFFLADGSIKIRLTSAAGREQVVADGVQVIGPSSGGGGGGGSVDATTVLTTGDIKTRYGTGALSGFVRANGRTIGSATSGASERANADTQPLFEYLWSADTGLAVSTGRGVSANADWVANKQLTLPDARGRIPAGLDDMGNSAAGRLTSYTMGSGTVLGAVGGFEKWTLALAQLPTGIGSSGSNTVSVVSTLQLLDGATIGSMPTTGGAQPVVFPGLIRTQTSTGVNSTSVLSNNTGGTPHPTQPPTILLTLYVKL